MSVGQRLREERQRLGLSQPAFAALAAATKGAQAKWEKDEASPNAKALIAFEKAGADVLYILTGRRTFPINDNVEMQVRDHLNAIRDNLLVPIDPAMGISEQQERDVLIRQLDGILRHDRARLPDRLLNEAEELKTIAADQTRLAAFRAADFAQLRARRRELRHQLDGWLKESNYNPSDIVIDRLATLALDFSVPLHLLAELVEEVGHDSRRPRSLADDTQR